MHAFCSLLFLTSTLYVSIICSIHDTRFQGVTWDDTAWVVKTTNIDQGHYQSRLSIANGYLGINVAAVGPFFEQDVQVSGDNVNGWPLFNLRQTFATIAGFFDSQPTTEGTNFPWLGQYGWDSVISGVPHWGGIVLDCNGPNGVYLYANVDSTTISNFSSSLDAKRGVATWSYTWKPKGIDTTFDIEYTMFAHKLYITQAIVQMQVTPSTDVMCSIVNILDGTSAVRANFEESGTSEETGGNQIYTAVTPYGLDNVTAYVYSAMDVTPSLDDSSRARVTDSREYIGGNKSSIAQEVHGELKAMQTTVATKYVGAATSDGFSDPKRLAQLYCTQAQSNGYDASLRTHVGEWATVFRDDSVDVYSSAEDDALPGDELIVESAITAVLNQYYLLQNTISANALANITNDETDASSDAKVAPLDSWSMSVCGLTSDCYGGQVFWDADIWIQPGLVLSHPHAAKQIAKYRAGRYDQAKANAQTSYQSSKGGKTFGKDTAVFPWTSGRFGNCTATGPCFDYEYHISGDIAQEFANYWLVSGDTDFFRSSLFPIYDSIATFYSQVVAQEGNQYILTNMTDPDEYADHVDNGGFTMPMIATTLNNTNILRQKFGVDPSTDFTNIASNIRIERDADHDIVLEYRGMLGSIVVKQADVVLNTFPLNYQTDYTAVDGLKDLDYYAAKQTLNGPGMTYAIFSIVAAAVDVAGCSSFTYQQYSEHPYARAPWFQFSEQLNDNFETNGGTHPAFPFLTGHGGANQITVFGYLGLRLTYDSALHINPSLPPQIPKLKYRTFYWQGFPISATSNQSHTTLTRLTTPLATCNSSFISIDIPILVGHFGSYTQYRLPPAGSTVVPNRNVSSYTSITGNIAQCLPANSPDAIVPGQLAIAAVDGAPSTKWQPASDTAATITITLGDQYSPVTSLCFDWAQAPPLEFTVWFHNSSIFWFHNSSIFDDTTATLVTQQSRVNISNPYDASKDDDIVPYVGNTTNVTLTPNVWSGRFARLSITGNQNGLGDGLGATVAEWAVVVDNGSQNTTSRTATSNAPTATRSNAKTSTSAQSLASSSPATVTTVPATIVSAAPSPSPNAAVIIYREDFCDDVSCDSSARIYATKPGDTVDVCANPKSIGSINYPNLDLTKDFDLKSSAFSTGGLTNCVFYGQNLPLPRVGENVGDLECAGMPPLPSIPCDVPAAQPTSCTSSHDLDADNWTPIAYCEWVAVIG